LEFGIPINIEDQPDLLDIQNFYRNTGGEFWGALSNDKVIGTIGLINIGNNSGVIRKMFVSKDYRGKDLGIAQLLLDTLIAHCKIINISDVYLGTQEILHAAIRFYQRNGFVQIEKNQLPQSFPVMTIDNAFYHLQLNHC
jgi:N-acetylglutamate synthase-like GNAT family acetyltransferase